MCAQARAAIALFLFAVCVSLYHIPCLVCVQFESAWTQQTPVSLKYQNLGGREEARLRTTLKEKAQSGVATDLHDLCDNDVIIKLMASEINHVYILILL